MVRVVVCLEISDSTYKIADSLIAMLKVRASVCDFSLFYGYYRSNFEYFEIAKYYFTSGNFFSPSLIKRADNETITLRVTHMPLTHSLLIGRMCFTLFVFSYNELSHLRSYILNLC